MLLSQIASRIGAELLGVDISISRAATLNSADGDSITFFANNKYLNALTESRAGACIMAERNAVSAPVGMQILVHLDPYAAWAQVLELLYPEPPARNVGIAKSSSVHPGASIGRDSSIGDFVVIEEGVVVGSECVIEPFVHIARDVVIGSRCRIGSGSSIKNARIGHNCNIYSGVRIGEDGFGFAHTASGLRKVKQIGFVVIGDSVEIGANSCIDRGALDDTVIMDGCKIDNMVQIGHNCVVGPHTVLCGQVGLAGSTRIGAGVMVGGQAGVAGHLKVGDKALIAAQSGVISDVRPAESMGGTPAVPIMQWHRMTAILKRLATKKE